MASQRKVLEEQLKSDLEKRLQQQENQLASQRKVLEEQLQSDLEKKLKQQEDQMASQREALKEQLRNEQLKHQQEQEAHKEQLKQQQEHQERQERQLKLQMEWQQEQQKIQKFQQDQQQIQMKILQNAAESSKADVDRMQEHVRKLEEKERESFEKTLSEVRKQGGEQITRLEKDLAQMTQDLQDEKEKLEEFYDPENFEPQAASLFDNFIQYVDKVPEPPKREKPSIAILGRRGVGKSSTANAIVGRTIAKTGVKDTTLVVNQVYGQADDHACEIWDVPGETDTRSYANLETLLKMKSMHIIFIVYIDDVQQCFNLVRLVSGCKVPFIIIRNKCDSIDADDAKEAEMTVDELRATTRQEEQEQLNIYMTDKLPGHDELKIIYASAKMQMGYEEVRASLHDKTGVVFQGPSVASGKDKQCVVS